MIAEAPRFEYHVKDWWPSIQAVDWIPLVGLVTSLERDRRVKGQPILETYFPVIKLFSERHRQEEIELLRYAGTKNWPKPADNAAALRSQAMAVRNMLFAVYHGAVPALSFIYGPRVVSSIASVVGIL